MRNSQSNYARPRHARLVLLAAFIIAGLFPWLSLAQPTLGTGGRGDLREIDKPTVGTGGSGSIERLDKPTLGTGGTGPLKPVNPRQAGQQAPSGPLTIVTGVEGLTVSNPGSITSDRAAEITATVVPPYANSACPFGRLLVSIDGVKDPWGGLIVGRDLNDLNGPTTRSTMSGYEQNATVNGQLMEVRQIRSNDQDIAVLPNGHVLYTRMGRTRAPLPLGTPWFNYAYKIPKTGSPWGPGARSEIFVFRSEDCGETFEMVGAIDTAKLLNGVGDFEFGAGGLPQPCDPSPPCSSGAFTLPNGTRVWQMAGTDGPLLKVDRETGHAYISVGLFGHLPKATDDGSFELSLDKEDFLSRTVVMRSTNGGEHWTRAAILGFTGWRLEVTPMPEGYLAFGAGASFRRTRVGDIAADGLSVLDGDVARLPGYPVRWEGWTDPGQDLSGNRLGGLRGQTMGARLPHPGFVLLLMRDTEDRTANGRKGYRAYALDIADPDGTFGEFLPAIMPQNEGAANFIYNPVVVDLGIGPVLVYWYDVTTNVRDPNLTQSVRLRGRLFLDKDRTTADFPISVPFDVVENRFFGHYQMVGGYHRIMPSGERRTVFFPVWITPGDKVNFARLEFREPGPRPDDALGEVGDGVLVMTGSSGIRAEITTEREISLEGHEEHLEEETELESRGLEMFTEPDQDN